MSDYFLTLNDWNFLWFNFFILDARFVLQIYPSYTKCATFDKLQCFHLSLNSLHNWLGVNEWRTQILSTEKSNIENELLRSVTPQFVMHATSLMRGEFKFSTYFHPFDYHYLSACYMFNVYVYEWKDRVVCYCLINAF